MCPGTFRSLMIVYTPEAHLADSFYENYAFAEYRTFLIASRVQIEVVFLAQMTYRFYTFGQMWTISLYFLSSCLFSVTSMISATYLRV